MVTTVVKYWHVAGPVLCLQHPSWFLQMLETAVCEHLWDTSSLSSDLSPGMPAPALSGLQSSEAWALWLPLSYQTSTYILSLYLWKCRDIVETSFLGLHRRASEKSGLARSVIHYPRNRSQSPTLSSLCLPLSPGTHYVDNAGLKLTVSWELGLKACANTHMCEQGNAYRTNKQTNKHHLIGS